MHQHNNAEGGGPGDSENTENEHESWMVNRGGRGRGVRPASQDSFPQPQQFQGNPYSDIVKNSVLSAEAAEFVPKAFTPASQMNAGHGSRNSVQDRLRLARQNQNVHQAMVQRNQGQPWQQQWQPQSGSSRHPGHRQHHQPTQFSQRHQHSQHHHHQYSDGGYRGAHHQHFNQYSNTHDYGHNDGGSANFSDKTDTGPIDLPTCLMKLEMAMNTLTMNPGMFDNLVAHLVNTVTPFLEQPNDCEQVFNLIIKQSVIEGNFRYSGARLCTHLDTVVLGDKSTSTFREMLINQCKQKTEEQAESWKEITKHTDDVEKKCHGLIFFLAELVTQMEPAPASELGKLLIRLINTVLQNPAPNSAKNICQALKLAGQTLERDNSGNRTEMEQVMRTLSDLVIQGRVDSHVGRMVTSVSELRSGNWGVTPSHTTREMENKQPSSSQVSDEPIFYGPDGQEITEEESRFLEEGDIEGEIAAQEPWENEEEADEVAAAYEEFLMLSMNNNKRNEKNVQSKY